MKFCILVFNDINKFSTKYQKDQKIVRYSVLKKLFNVQLFLFYTTRYEDFKEAGSEAATKAAGKYRQQGRNYIVEDGDIIFFKFNAGAGLTAGKKK